MRNRLNFLIAAVLMVGSVFAQQPTDTEAALVEEGSEFLGESPEEPTAQQPTAQYPSISVRGILDELMAYTGEQTPAAVVVEPTPVANPDEMPVAVVESTEESTEPEALVEEASVLFADDFTAASQDLADLAKIAPEKVAARMYRRTLMERDQRTAEIDGLDAVDAAWSTDMVLRSYDLISGAGERMKLGDETRAVDVDTLFPQVEFPKGASAIYQPKTKTIFVNNTPENLAVLEAMMETMGVLKGFGDSDQVEIEAKFIEVSEGTLEELGFDWDVKDLEPSGSGLDGLIVNQNQGAFYPDPDWVFNPITAPVQPLLPVFDAGGVFRDALRGKAARTYLSPGPDNLVGTADDLFETVAGSLPFSQTAVGDGQTSGNSGAWNSDRFKDTFSTAPGGMTLNYSSDSYEIDLLISVLDQSSGTDVLSAPRILTRSGEEASIQVGELHSYPEVYETGSSQSTVPHIAYEDFSEKLLGVELTVTPVVTDERFITLELNPRITELAGWQTYQLAPAYGTYGYYQGDGKTGFGNATPIVASLPIFKKREIQTQVTIADGGTIGMGGLINEKNESFEDKVPVLGSLPLVGRLFRNEGERVIKRNLLMFVKATIIDPNGRIDTSRSFE